MTELVSTPRNTVLHGDCISVLGSFAPSTVDFILTDPPYLVRYQSRGGRRVHNDDNAAWDIDCGLVMQNSPKACGMGHNRFANPSSRTGKEDDAPIMGHRPAAQA